MASAGEALGHIRRNLQARILGHLDHQPVCIAPFRCIARTGHGALAAKGEFDELVGRAQRASDRHNRIARLFGLKQRFNRGKTFIPDRIDADHARAAEQGNCRGFVGQFGRIGLEVGPAQVNPLGILPHRIGQQGGERIGPRTIWAI